MAGLRCEISSRVLSWDSGSWNHRRRMIWMTPMLLFAGGIASVLLQSALAHRGVTIGPDGVFTLALMLAALFLGYLVLAVID